MSIRKLLLTTFLILPTFTIQGAKKALLVSMLNDADHKKAIQNLGAIVAEKDSKSSIMEKYTLGETTLWVISKGKLEGLLNRISELKNTSEEEINDQKKAIDDAMKQFGDNLDASLLFFEDEYEHDKKEDDQLLLIKQHLFRIFARTPSQKRYGILFPPSSGNVGLELNELGSQAWKEILSKAIYTEVATAFQNAGIEWTEIDRALGDKHILDKLRSICVNESGHETILQYANRIFGEQVSNERILDKELLKKGRDVKKKVLKIVLVGATGAGKTTLINSMVNFLFGVECKDTFRYKLNKDDKEADQTQSDTKEITEYFIPLKDHEYDLIIVDTPGFGDTGGIEVDTINMKNFNNYLAFNKKKESIDLILFVVKSSTTRLTGGYKYIFNLAKKEIGKDMLKEKIYLVVTFGDNGKPPVLDAVREALGLDMSTKHIKANSSGFSVGPYSEIKELFFNLGTENFKHLMKVFNQIYTTGGGTVYETEAINSREWVNERIDLGENDTEPHQFTSNQKKKARNKDLPMRGGNNTVVNNTMEPQSIVEKKRQKTVINNVVQTQPIIDEKDKGRSEIQGDNTLISNSDSGHEAFESLIIDEEEEKEGTNEKILKGNTVANERTNANKDDELEQKYMNISQDNEDVQEKREKDFQDNSHISKRGPLPIVLIITAFVLVIGSFIAFIVHKSFSKHKKERV